MSQYEIYTLLTIGAGAGIIIIAAALADGVRRCENCRRRCWTGAVPAFTYCTSCGIVHAPFCQTCRALHAIRGGLR